MSRIFVSSTFVDMHAERDMIQKEVAPQLRKVARACYDNVELVDLRWGVDTCGLDEVEASKYILEVCVREVEQCHPYMLIFLGERYGTVVEQDVVKWGLQNHLLSDLEEDGEYSTTALEIEVGLLKQQYGNIENSVICLRNPVSDTIGDDYKNQYTSASEKDALRLKRLKERLLKIGVDSDHIIYYDAAWDEEKKCITSLRVGEQDLSEVLVSCFQKIFAEKWCKIRCLNEYERAQLDGKNLAQSFGNKCFGRDDFIEDCMELLEAKDLLVLEGEEGIGKTTIASRLAMEYEKKGVAVFYFYGGTGGFITSGYELYVHVRDFLSKHEGERVFLCIDGIDSLVRDDYVAYLRFLPKLGAKCKALISYKENESYCGLGEELMIRDAAWLYREYQVLCVPKLGMVSKIDIINNSLLVRGKKIRDRLIAEIMKKGNSGNPLYLAVVLKYMDLADGADLRALGSAMAIEEFFLAEIQSIPDGLEDAMRALFEKCVQKLGLNGYLVEAFSLIASSRNGLRQDDIICILNEEKETDMAVRPYEFSAIRQYLDMFFNEDSNGVITFRHEILKSIFSVRVPSRQEDWNEDLIVRYMMDKLPNTDFLRSRDELEYMLSGMNKQYYKYLMERIAEIAEKGGSPSQLADLKYYGWYGHGKHLIVAMEKCFQKLPEEKKERLLEFFVDDYFKLFDGSAEELGQIQLLYRCILETCVPRTEYPKHPERKQYIVMKCNQIMGYIVERRESSWAIEFLESVQNCCPDEANGKTSEEIIRLLARIGQSSRSDEEYYEDRIALCRFEAGIQWMLANNQMTEEMAKTVILIVKGVEEQLCDPFLCDMYVEAELYRIRNTVPKAHQEERLHVLFDEIRRHFESSHAMSDLINMLKVQIEIGEKLTREQNFDAIAQWREAVQPLMRPLDKNHEITNGRVVRAIQDLYERARCQ